MNFKIVGLVSDEEEADEMQLIAEHCVIGWRVIEISSRHRKRDEEMKIDKEIEAKIEAELIQLMNPLSRLAQLTTFFKQLKVFQKSSKELYPEA